MGRRHAISRRRMIAALGITGALACAPGFRLPGGDVPPGAAATATAAASSSASKPLVPTPVPATPTPDVAAANAMLDRPLAVGLGLVQLRTSPRELGFTVAYEEGRPRLHRPRDDAAMDRLIDLASRASRREPIDADLRISADGRVTRVPARPGEDVDRPLARERILAAIDRAEPRADLPMTPVPIRVADDLTSVAFARANRLLDGAPPYLTARRDDRFWTFNRKDFASVLAIAPARPGVPARLVPDEMVLEAFLKKFAPVIETEPVNARFSIEAGRAKVIDPGKPGQQLDHNGALAAFQRALDEESRLVILPVRAIPPRYGPDSAPSLEVSELIEKGSTPLGGAIPEKRHNVTLAASRLNGYVVAPGDVFSFNRAVGPTTLDAGFKWGYGITNSEEGIRTVPSIAGGICQVSTTLFQAVFWAGYPLEERYWHLYWIPSYASRGIVGLDVTVDEEFNVDFKWINSSKTPIVIQARVEGDNIIFELHGRKPGWQIEVAKPIITNANAPDPEPVLQPDPALPWGRTLVIEAPRDGFFVELSRTVTGDGPEKRILKMKSNYLPSRSVTLVGTMNKPPELPIEAAFPKGTPTPIPPVRMAPDDQRTPFPTRTPNPATATAIALTGTATPTPGPGTPTVTPGPGTPTVAPATGTPRPRG
ncbi:MAG: hypothetical protein FJ033_00635 [Chloroflexi bacterium]|nr:hypothetical protein [Chloroflexota bacterium]